MPLLKMTLTLAVFALVAACATPSQMTTGPSVLGANGQVEVNQGPNGNTLVKVTINHLASPDKVAPGAKVYVVWIQSTDGGTQQNVGQIQISGDEKGVLETLTPFKSFIVTVTAEPASSATTPTSNPVLTTRIVGKS